jgi:putative acetyltransferase
MEKSQMPQRGAAFRLAPRRAADLPDLFDLWVESWQAAMPQIDFEARRDWFRTQVMALEAGGALTICGFDAEDRLAGFALLVPQKSHLEQIAVHPRHFGSGLASRLLGEAKSLCPGGLTLDVNADNPRALRFYEREGFARIAAGTNELSGLATWRLRWP